MSNNLINIKNYGVPHGSGNGGGGGNTYITYNGTNERDTSRYVGNKSFQNIDGDSCQFTYIMANEGEIQKLSGDEINYNFGYIGELESDSIKAGKVDTDELNAVKGFIENLDCKKITTEYLTVTKQAHFFELIIDKVRAVGGQIILTPAQCTIDKVYAYNSNNQLVSDPVTNINSVAYFNVYWRNEDELGHGITNDWLVHDQALCQSFNVTAGTHHNIANKYYWRHVDSVLADKMINFETNEIKNVGDSLTATNNISISMMPTYGSGIANGITWTASAQSISGVYTGVTWDNGSSQTYAVTGTMHTSSTTFGIQILPSGDYATLITGSLTFHIYNTDGNIAQPQMNVGVYFGDGTSLYFPNVQVDSNFDVTLDLGSPNVAIEAIVVNCSQPVQWHQCHGIRLSNTNCDEMISPQASVPEEGDTIVQLGYQGTDEENSARQSAIIIAAYQTPDADLTAPSYAQYMGINDFHLREHRGSYIDANGAEFLGDIRLAKIGTDAQGNVITMSELVVDVNGIRTRVKNTEDELSSFESSITQTADRIALRVTKTENDIETANSNISVNAENIRIETRNRENADDEIYNYIDVTKDGIISVVSNSYVSYTALDNRGYTTSTEVQLKIDQYNAGVFVNWINNTYNHDIDSLEDDVNTAKGDADDAKTQVSGLSTSLQETKLFVRDINNGLIETGIDVTNHKITITSDNLILKSNEGGDKLWFLGKDTNGNEIFKLGRSGNNTPYLRFSNSISGATGYSYYGHGNMYIHSSGAGALDYIQGTASNYDTEFKIYGVGGSIIASIQNETPKISINNTSSNKEFHIYVDTNGRVRIGGTALQRIIGSQDGLSKGEIYIDGGGFLKIKQ